MPPTKLDLAELRRSMEAMTPGDWESDCSGSLHLESAQCGIVNAEGHTLLDTLNRDYRHTEVGFDDGRYFDKGGRPDADGIVALRNAAPALLTEIERLRKVEEAARAYCDPGRHAHNCTKGKGMSWEPEYPCSCGLDALRKALGGENGG